MLRSRSRGIGKGRSRKFWKVKVGYFTSVSATLNSSLCCFPYLKCFISWEDLVGMMVFSFVSESVRVTRLIVLLVSVTEVHVHYVISTFTLLHFSKSITSTAMYCSNDIWVSASCYPVEINVWRPASSLPERVVKSSSRQWKKSCGFWFRISFEWRHMWSTFRPLWPTSSGPGPKPLDRSISLTLYWKLV